MIWFLSPLALKTARLPTHFPHAFNFITSNLDTSQYSLACSTFLSLWKGRNNLLFRGTLPQPLLILSKPTNETRLSKQNNKKTTVKSKNGPYTAPQNSEVILVDASWDSTGRAGLASVCYDIDDNLFRTLSQCIETDSPFTAETHAVLMVLKYIAACYQNPRVPKIIFTDSRMLVNCLDGAGIEEIPNWRSQEVFAELISVLGSSSINAILQHATRDATVAADRLPKWVRKNGSQGC